jgi:rRNA-processing protein FCF1
MGMVEINNSTIVVDTSVLLAIYEVKKDPFEDLDIKEIYLPGPVVRELEKLEKESKKYGAAKRLIFKLLSLYNIILGKEEGTFADEVILRLVSRYKVFFTNDKMLKKELKKKGVIVYSFGESGVYR